ncbi:MAG: 50S ribosomal protein L6 [Lentisphaeria bacterium]|jgi:large subunit ribosomal protein L6|nr:50S ribosomal protein L6 [Lentisphaeria bacterium]MDP7740231.1 50S ribosomal protein L6 [Lentisphaeria bacterium]
MSRVGNKPIPVGKAKVEISGKCVKVSGSRGTMEHNIPEVIDASLDGDVLVVARTSESRQARSLHGMTRSLLSNMVEGVETGFKKDLEIRGVGYRAATKGKTMTLNVGFSHPVEYPIPENIEITVNENTKITVQGMNKQQVGQVAADIRAYHPPEPYKGKGIRYIGEFVLQKVGKSI